MSTAGGAYIAIAISSGLAAAIIGRIKGSSFVIWFFVGAMLPLIGILAALAYRYDIHELRRQCPECGRVTKLHDAVCVRCGAELEFPDVAIAPESARYTR